MGEIGRAMSERPRMDRKQLKEARRTIERLVRSKAAVTRRKAKTTEPAPPPERPEGYRQTVHLGCKAADLQDLDKIAGDMRKHPIHGRGRPDPSREKAALFAIAQFARLPVDKWPA